MKEYEQIRYLHEQEHLSQRQIAQRLQLSRNTVKKYLNGKIVPWERKEGTGKNCTALTPEIKDFIQACLDEDAALHLRKQFHTARRIYNRLVEELSFTGGESTVRKYVGELKGSLPKDVFIPLSYAPAECIQVDWGEVVVFLKGDRVKLNIWCMRECFSKKFFVQVFYRQNEESFLEGIRNGLEYFDGVPKKILFDNAKVAVKEGFGLHAKATDKYLALSAHYSFQPLFCNIAEGHEKGLVEGLVKYIRKNAFVPVPRVQSIQELNEFLLQKCEKYNSHTVPGETRTVGESYEIVKEYLAPLPEYRYDTRRTKVARANEFSMVSFDHNQYSIPVQYCNRDITIKGSGNTVEIISQNTKIASYDRDYAYEKKHYKLEHYLPLLERRKRSILDASPVKQNIPQCLYSFLEKCNNPKEVYQGITLYLQYGDKMISLLPEVTSLAAMQAELIEVKKSYRQKDPAPIRVIPHDLGKYNTLIGGRA